MINRIRDRLRKMRRRRSMRLRPGRGTRSASRFRASTLGPALKIGGLAAGAVALVLVIIFVIVPLFGGKGASQPEQTASATPSPELTPIARNDMSDLDEELAIAHKSINDPYVHGREVVFSTGAKEETSPEIKQIAIYNMDAKETAVVEGITAEYATLFEPKINENYIVYLDCKDKFGGAVCGFDRATNEKFVMRTYFYGKPKVTLRGDYALWLQQAGKGTDRLYLYHLPTRETVEIEIFVNTPFALSTPYMSDDAIVYVQPNGESQVLDGSSASTEAEICVLPLAEKGDTKRILFQPGVPVFDPMIDGDNIVFMDTNRDEKARLLLCTRQGDGYSQPTLIAEGVVNYAVGDGFVAYTMGDSVYVYYFADGSSGRVSADNMRALLASVNGKDMVWYDITDLGNANVVFHALMP